jgi:hypothetical protein
MYKAYHMSICAAKRTAIVKGNALQSFIRLDSLQEIVAEKIRGYVLSIMIISSLD